MPVELVRVVVEGSIPVGSAGAQDDDGARVDVPPADCDLFGGDAQRHLHRAVEAEELVDRRSVERWVSAESPAGTTTPQRLTILVPVTPQL